MTDPILFLDFDGVLNSTDWYNRRPHRGNRPHDELDPAAVGRLATIVAATHCKIVVSSTWRLTYPRLHIIHALRGVCGIRLPIIGETPDGVRKQGKLWAACQRGEEIQAWRTEHGHTGPFVVLDDDTDMDDVVDHFVQTSFATGLLDEHVDEAIALMSSQQTTQETTP